MSFLFSLYTGRLDEYAFILSGCVSSVRRPRSRFIECESEEPRFSMFQAKIVRFNRGFTGITPQLGKESDFNCSVRQTDDTVKMAVQPDKGND